MVRKVLSTIRKLKMLERGGKVVAAVSGGVDSVVMLHVLRELAHGLGLELVVCHLDHGLRGEESRRDLEFVKSLAGELGLVFEGGSLALGTLKERTGEPLQAAARKARYEFFERTAEKHKAVRVAIGHTMDDQAETVLMRFLKGASIGGLSGIPAKRGIFIRPLIEVTRAEIEVFAEKKGIRFVQDSSNLKPGYLRNDIRLNLIPYIKERYNPNLIETLARTSAVLARDDDYLTGEALLYLEAALVKSTDSTLFFDRRVLKRIPPALLSRVFLWAAWQMKVGAALLSSHISACLDAACGQRPNAVVRLPDGLRFIREYELVKLTKEPPEKAKEFSAELEAPGMTIIESAGIEVRATILDTPPVKFGLDRMAAFFDFDALPAPLVFRSRMPGDRMRPIGMEGHKKLKDIFIDCKVPVSTRRTVPVLTAGGDVVWAVGVRQSELYKVTQSTKKVLKVECSGSKKKE